MRRSTTPLAQERQRLASIRPCPARSTAAARWPPNAIESFSACSSGRTRPPRDAIQVAIRIRMRQVQRRWCKSVAQCQSHDRQLDAARSIHQMAEHRLGGADANRISRAAKRSADPAAFHHVVLLSARAMGIDVSDIAGATPDDRSVPWINSTVESLVASRLVMCRASLSIRPPSTSA